MQSQKISLITVNYSSINKIIKLWNSLLKFAQKLDWELIIVDNFSTENEQGNLQKFRENLTPNQKANLHIVYLQKNLGFSTATNEGVRFAKSDILTIVNPDTEIEKNTLENLIQTLQTEKNAGIVAPILTSSSGELLENSRKFPTLWSLLWERIFGRSALKISREIFTSDWVQGSFFVIKKSFFQKLGGFDEKFFLFMEDVDLCRRCWASGKQVIVNTKAKAIHSADRLSGGNIIFALFRKTFWIHILSATKYFFKWRKQKIPKTK